MMPKLSYDVGTAYDLFISLIVLHDPARFGLRGAWAAGVRSRLLPEARELLQTVTGLLLPPLAMVHELPPPKDGRSLLDSLAALEPRQRLARLVLGPREPEQWRTLFERVTGRGAWTPTDEAELESLRGQVKGWRPKGATAALLALLAEPEETGEQWLAALSQYHEVFFAEEERRIGPALQTAVNQAQELAGQLALPALLEELTEGLRFAEAIEATELVIIPSFWTTPLLLTLPADDSGGELFVFGARPADASLVPGEVIPDRLFQALKALADPTRLRILRYLTAEPLSPAELARRLRLRAPTVIHHLDALRLARLVYLTLDREHRRLYAVRPEAVRATFTLLEAFLGQASPAEVADLEEEFPMTGADPGQ